MVFVFDSNVSTVSDSFYLDGNTYTVLSVPRLTYVISYLTKAAFILRF